MRYAYFPGCTLRSSSSDYDLSFRFVARALGIELREVNDWVCCGATVAPSVSHLTSLTLPLLNLSYAEKDGHQGLIAPCPACLSRFKTAQIELKENPDLRPTMDRILNDRYHGKIEVTHPLEVFLKLGLEKILQKTKKKLSGLRVACYYGCLLTRPPKMARFDKVEDPQSMDAIVKALGAQPVEWSFKTECCGNTMALTYSEIVLKLTHDILREAKTAGAHLIVVACPLCQANLDGRQRQVEETFKTRHRIPVLYLTQLMGFAFGAFPKEVGIQKLITSPRDVLGPVGLL